MTRFAHERVINMSSFRDRAVRAAAAVLSGWLLALAGSLHPSWMAAWIGSVPVLVAAFTATGRGARLLGLIAVASSEELAAIRTELGGFAHEAKMNITVGFRILATTKARIVLLVFTSDDRTVSYDKQHLVPAVETPKITAGAASALLAEIGGHRLGGAICKDFDFVDVGRSLGRGRAGLVVAPAWDFRMDGWLHGRMAMLRAI
jgi:predicted amidohydrolase